MSIMEKNLPVADSVNDGDYLRMVTSGGNSKNVLASEVGGGGVFNVKITTSDGESFTSDKSPLEIKEAMEQGMQIVVDLYYGSGDSMDYSGRFVYNVIDIHENVGAFQTVIITPTSETSIKFDFSTYQINSDKSCNRYSATYTLNTN